MTEQKPLLYRVAVQSYFPDLGILLEGSTVLYDGNPSENLIPTCDEGRARQKAYFAEREQLRLQAKQDQARQMMAAIGVASGQPTQVPQLDASAVANMVREAVETAVAALKTENDELRAALSKFDGDGDGKPGGRKAKAETTA